MAKRKGWNGNERLRNLNHSQDFEHTYELLTEYDEWTDKDLEIDEMLAKSIVKHKKKRRNK